MDWKRTLRGRLAARRAPKKSEQELKDEEMELFTKYYVEWKGGRKGGSISYMNIPRFYYRLPAEDEVLLQKLREESRAVFLQRKSRELLDNEELQNLWFLLDKHQTSPMIGEEAMINYENFLKVGEKAGPKCKQFFTAKIFAKLLHNDPYGRISIMQFFNYVMRKVWLHQTRIGLSLYDVAGQGYLRESDLENYILELIPTLPQLDGLEKSFYSFYVCTAVRKFFFFLDPLRTDLAVPLKDVRVVWAVAFGRGKIKIQDILACSFLDDLLELRDEELSKESQETNWFSAPSALRVYGQYLNLDKDHNGMLSKEELSRYGTGTLTNIFLDRVFQECLTYDGEMDYKTYLDFVLALENRKEPAALQYIFKLLDIENKGYLNVFSLNYFFRLLLILTQDLQSLPPNCGLCAIQEQMKIHGQEPVSFQDVKDEIFDMVKPKDPYKISLQDLINSSQGDTVTSILIDLNGFWTYENREVLVASDNDNTGDVDDT
ncbi:serine/threonine-protein phosphatase 2A regulatory subunit B'' subunit gamma isoform X1 [Harpia harpyja]|uniref:serine/threonine-protein phosphatase 2A regulatory subunit B'' subunit gamma isoform X1 n=2 Tax=Harpia harpyja TaxID=202280 RepID=UPI0022B0EED0|nr:serine/threonine-protein phosphatase 2A regulatory subunit B'' subunit gamma isoform X1 [Harpia harpyja]